MTVTITLKGVLLTVIALALIVLLIYAIALLKKLIGTLKKMDEILEDTKAITAVASERVQQVDGIVGDLGESVAVMVEAAKGNQSTIAALTHIVDAASSLTGIFKGRKKGDDADKETKKQKKKDKK